MKIISVKIHQAIDCIMALLLICSQWLFGFAGNKPAELVPIIIGVLIIVMALFTNYGLGIVRIIPMRIHLIMDMLAGLLLAVSPWLFGFYREVYLPHLILGIIEIGGAMMTDSQRRDNPALT